MKKKAARGKKGKNYKALLFWIAFAAVVILLFLVNLPKIRDTVSSTQLGERFPLLGTGEDAAPLDDAPAPVAGGATSQDAGRVALDDAAAFDNAPSLEDALSALNGAPIENAADTTEKAADGSYVTRTIYFMRVDGNGVLLRTPEKRSMKASGAPLKDTIEVLLLGVNADEEKKGSASLIPSGVKLLSASIRGTTAVLNFSEGFMFNTYGAEGYLAQLRQIVWTATEFPSVSNVQFLVEGQRVDFLGDNLRIDKPVARSDL